MKLLVDHGAYNNLGDIAQLEGTVPKLGSVVPGADIFVIDRPSVRTEIWHLPRVHRQNEYRVSPPLADLFTRAPILWRYADRWRRLTEQLALDWLERRGTVSAIRLGGGGAGSGERASLGEFCAPFDALLISGGGNLTDTFHEQLFHKCCLVLAFAATGKPIVLTGQQLGRRRRARGRRDLDCPRPPGPPVEGDARAPGGAGSGVLARGLRDSGRAVYRRAQVAISPDRKLQLLFDTWLGSMLSAFRW